MAITSEIRTYRLTGITPMLGSNPANPKIHSEFVASKAATIEKSLEETSMLPSEDELREKLGSLIKEKDIAVILITSTLLNMIRDTVYDLKLRLERPLIIEIPDRHGNGRTKDSITKYVKDAIGVDMS